jgi:hypothetical protein
MILNFPKIKVNVRIIPNGPWLHVDRIARAPAGLRVWPVVRVRAYGDERGVRKPVRHATDPAAGSVMRA